MTRGGRTSGWRGRRHYRFRSLWLLPAAPARVYRALEYAEDYPHWWPQVREVAPLDASSGAAVIRSLLPYDLRFTASAVRRDPRGMVLEVALRGDLHGWARFTVLPNGRGSTVLFEQRVEVRKPLLRLLSVPGRPLLTANHALMMSAGRRGLRRRLERSLDDP